MMETLPNDVLLKTSLCWQIWTRGTHEWTDGHETYEKICWRCFNGTHSLFMQRRLPGGHEGFHGPPHSASQRFQVPPLTGMAQMGGPRGPFPSLMQGYNQQQ
jgi:hypothetical protein